MTFFKVGNGHGNSLDCLLCGITDKLIKQLTSQQNCLLFQIQVGCSSLFQGYRMDQENSNACWRLTFTARGRPPWRNVGNQPSMYAVSNKQISCQPCISVHPLKYYIKPLQHACDHYWSGKTDTQSSLGLSTENQTFLKVTMAYQLLMVYAMDANANGLFSLANKGGG